MKVAVIVMERMSLSWSCCNCHGGDCPCHGAAVLVLELAVGCDCHSHEGGCHCHGAAVIVMELAVIVMEQLSLSWSSSLSRKEQVQ